MTDPRFGAIRALQEFVKETEYEASTNKDSPAGRLYATGLTKAACAVRIQISELEADLAIEGLTEED